MNLAYGLVAAGVVAAAVLIVMVRSRRPAAVPEPLVRALLDRLEDAVAVYDPQGAVYRTNAAWNAAGGGGRGTPVVAAFGADPVGEWMEESGQKRQSVGALFCRWKGGAVILGLTPLVDEFGDLLGGVMVVSPAPQFNALVAEAGLTAREAELLVPILQGRTYRQAAESLSIGEATVKSHLQAVFRKTGCRSRHELAARVLPGV